MTDDNSDWKDFLTALAELLEKFRKDSVSLEDVYAELSRFMEVQSIGDEIVEFCMNSMSEISGSPNNFEKLLSMARESVSRETFLDYMNS